MAAEPEQPYDEAGDDGLLPAWSLSAAAAPDLTSTRRWPSSLDREWAWGGSTGAGVRVCIVDSGIEADHPLVGGVARAVAIEVDDDGAVKVTEDEEGDLCGHGTACAGVIRSIAPDCELHSVRVLGAGFTGSGPVLLAGLHWALKEGYDVVNMSLSTTKSQFAADAPRPRRQRLLQALADRRLRAQHAGRELPVALLVRHLGREPRQPRSAALLLEPRRRRSRSSRTGSTWRWPGSAARASARPGNSFATPHIPAIAALILAKHPGLAPFELKNLLYLTADNVGVEP